MALTSTEIAAIVFIVFLAAIVAGLLLYLLRRLRHRRDKLVADLSTKPELAQDRAFNRIAMARREVEIVARTGVDVGSARALIAQAQGAFDTRNYDRAYEVAQSAHEALVVARRSGTMPPTYAAPLRTDPTPNPGPGPAAAPASAPAAGSTFPKIPQNRAESQFQLRLLDQELDTARAGKASDARLSSASALRDQGRAAFDRGDFTEAFRLALKGRRALGEDVGALAPTAATRAAPHPSDGDGAIDDPAAAAERMQTAERCPDCGYPALPNDQFCRGCGRPRVAATCPACGAARNPGDTFCGRCGQAFS